MIFLMLLSWSYSQHNSNHVSLYKMNNTVSLACESQEINIKGELTDLFKETFELISQCPSTRVQYNPEW